MNTAEDMVRDKGGDIISVAAAATISTALQVMVKNKGRLSTDLIEEI